MSFVPDFLKENDDFIVFLALAFSEFDIAQENISKFTDLINPDKVPIEFLEALGSFFNFTYIQNASEEFNREALMRMRSIWEQRGTEHSIIMAGTHGYSDGYIGGDMFITDVDFDEESGVYKLKYPISKELAEIDIPREFTFIHSKSDFSGIDLYESEFVRSGVIYLKVPYLDDHVKEALYRVTPAGVKYAFGFKLDFNPSDGAEIGEYGELSFHKSFRIYPKTEEERQAGDVEVVDTDIDFWIRMDIPVSYEEESEEFTIFCVERISDYHVNAEKEIMPSDCLYNWQTVSSLTPSDHRDPSIQGDFTYEFVDYL